jgi:hypothetical protein
LNWKPYTQAAVCIVLSLAGLSVSKANAQAAATAYANVRLSAFAGFSGNYTGLALAKNGDISAGADIGFRPFRGFYPAIEGRGLYPVAKSDTVNVKNALAGLRVGRRKDRLSGYGDILFGRGKIDYPNGFSDPTGTFLVVSNTTNVISFGGGVDWDWTEHFGLKGDIQLQRYDTPVTTSGDIFSKVFTAALVYRFGSGSVR